MLSPDVPSVSSSLGLETVNRVEEVPSDFGEQLRTIRRHLHRQPEIGQQEYETARFIRRTLEGQGLNVQGPIGRTGQYVDIEGTTSGPQIGYRADIDALPTDDAKEVGYASQHEGAAHLCGHDAHTTVAIGVALLLHRLRDQLAGTVRVFFQPNEEGMPSGAPVLIDEGILDGLEAVYAIHVDPTLEVGRYGMLSGPVTAAADRFDVHIEGPSTGHSARPHETPDTAWIAVQIANALYQLNGRITDPRNASVVTICKLAGGSAHNVIPRNTLLGGTLRCIDSGDRETLKTHIARVAQETAARYGAQAKVEFAAGPPPVINDGRLVENVASAARSLFGNEAIHHIPRPSMGAEDFAHYTQHVPGALIRVGTASGPDTSYPLHDAHFDLDERALAPTVQLMTMALRNHLRRRVLH